MQDVSRAECGISRGPGAAYGRVSRPSWQARRTISGMIVEGDRGAGGASRARQAFRAFGAKTNDARAPPLANLPLTLTPPPQLPDSPDSLSPRPTDLAVRKHSRDNGRKPIGGGGVKRLPAMGRPVHPSSDTSFHSTSRLHVLPQYPPTQARRG